MLVKRPVQVMFPELLPQNALRLGVRGAKGEELGSMCRGVGVFTRV